MLCTLCQGRHRPEHCGLTINWRYFCYEDFGVSPAVERRILAELAIAIDGKGNAPRGAVASVAIAYLYRQVHNGCYCTWVLLTYRVDRAGIHWTTGMHPWRVADCPHANIGRQFAGG